MLGPIQLYEAPAIVAAFRFKVAPTHRGPLLPATGGFGVGVIDTVTAPGWLTHPLTATTTLYVPES